MKKEIDLLKKDIITISSLELMASTPFDTKFILPMIDARRNCVYAGVYDQDLNSIKADSYINYDELSEYFADSLLVSYDDLKDTVNPKVDILKIVSKHINDKSLNPHQVNPNYLKKVEAEEKKEQENDKKSS